MVRRRRRLPRLLAGGVLLLGSVGPPCPLGRAEDASREPAKRESAKKAASSEVAKGGDAPLEEAAPAPRAGEGERAGPAPIPLSREVGREDSAGPASAEGDEALVMRVLELEDAIWRQVESVESRLGGIKARLLALRGPGIGVLQRGGAPLRGSGQKPVPAPEEWVATGPPDPDALVPPGEDFLLSTTAGERRYVQLLRLEDDLLRRWRRAAPSPEGKGVRRVSPASSGKERRALREELRGVLTEILDAREAARERQIEGLRREIDDIERAIDSRRDEAERKRLVEGRLEELLGPWPEPVQKPQPERP